MHSSFVWIPCIRTPDSNPETKKKMSIEERTAEMKEKKRLAKVAKMKAKEVKKRKPCDPVFILLIH